MSKPNQNSRGRRTWQRRHDALAPRAEDLASDLVLRDVDGENSVCFFDSRGKKAG